MKVLLLACILLWASLMTVVADVLSDPAIKESPRPMMVDAAHGWWHKVTKDAVLDLRTEDGGQHWQNVTPPGLANVTRRMVDNGSDMFLSDASALSPLDAQRAWAIYRRSDEYQGTALAYTADGGAHWREILSPVRNDYRIVGTFLDEQRGFLLGGRANNHLTVYGTEDGGNRWYVLGNLPLSVDTQVSLTFRSPDEGWFTFYKLEEDGDKPITPLPAGLPLYHTTDGGLTWQPQTFALPAAYQDTEVIVNVGTPVFVGTDKQRGYLPVQLIGKAGQAKKAARFEDAWINYETEDGGKTWHLPARES